MKKINSFLNKHQLKIIGLIILLFSLILILNLHPFASAEYQIPREFKPELSPDIANSKDGASYNYTTISIFLQFLAGNILFFAGAIAVALLVIAGAIYATAMGNDTQLESAKKTITWIFIGLFAMIISFSAIRFVINVFLKLPQ